MISKEVNYIKVALHNIIVDFHNNSELTSREIAKKVKLDAGEYSRLINNVMDRSVDGYIIPKGFSLEKYIDIVTRLGYDLSFVAKKS